MVVAVGSEGQRISRIGARRHARVHAARWGCGCDGGSRVRVGMHAAMRPHLVGVEDAQQEVHRALCDVGKAHEGGLDTARARCTICVCVRVITADTPSGTWLRIPPQRCAAAAAAASGGCLTRRAYVLHTCARDSRGQHRIAARTQPHTRLQVLADVGQHLGAHAHALPTQRLMLLGRGGAGGGSPAAAAAGVLGDPAWRQVLCEDRPQPQQLQQAALWVR